MATLSENADKRIEEIKKLYPDARSAIMPALYLVQDELGTITKEGVEWVSTKIGVAPVHVWEVATFYTMYYKKPIGRYHVQVCRTLPCALCGAKKITEHLKKRFGLEPHQVSKDGMWSYEEVECLGSCGTAPMCEINDTFFENLTPEKIDQIIEKIGKEKPELRFSTARDDIGAGLPGSPKSEVI